MDALDNILNEIETETISELFTSVRCLSTPVGPLFFPSLEKCFLSTSGYSSTSTTSISYGDVIEVRGPPASGKTHLVYHFCMNCILPVNCKGWNKYALYYDCDNTFDISRFTDILYTRLQKLTISTPELSGRCEQIKCAALSRLHIFRPESTSQLVATLVYLPTYRLQHLTEHDIGLISIDSLSAFHWQDRFFQEMSTSDRSTASPLEGVLDALNNCRRCSGCLTILTHWSPHSGADPQPEAPHRVSTYQITLSLPVLPKNSFGSSSEDQISGEIQRSTSQSMKVRGTVNINAQTSSHEVERCGFEFLISTNDILAC